MLARGGGRMNEESVFARTLETLEQGASGIVYGRNIIQHPKPKQMTQALMAVVHQRRGGGRGDGDSAERPPRDRRVKLN